MKKKSPFPVKFVESASQVRLFSQSTSVSTQMSLPFNATCVIDLSLQAITSNVINYSMSEMAGSAASVAYCSVAVTNTFYSCHRLSLSKILSSLRLKMWRQKTICQRSLSQARRLTWLMMLRAPLLLHLSWQLLARLLCLQPQPPDLYPRAMKPHCQPHTQESYQKSLYQSWYTILCRQYPDALVTKVPLFRLSHHPSTLQPLYSHIPRYIQNSHPRYRSFHHSPSPQHYLRLEETMNIFSAKKWRSGGSRRRRRRRRLWRRNSARHHWVLRMSKSVSNTRRKERLMTWRLCSSGNSVGNFWTF